MGKYFPFKFLLQPLIYMIIVAFSFVLFERVFDFGLNENAAQRPELPDALGLKNGNKHLKLNLSYSHFINGIKANVENTYITQPNYTHRHKPTYFNDPVSSTYQMTTYYSAGELARRYHARYIVDLGCGAGTKLAAFHKEFHLIGIDYKGNLDIVKEKYPFIERIEADLDQGSDCLVDIPPGVLTQAVVISSDVIEHLVNPFSCYIKLLQRFTSQAMAVVLSTPDRQKLNARFASGNVRGPPYNPSHVREWLVEELEILFLDLGMYPVALGWECVKEGLCGSGFTPETNPHTTAIVFMANTPVRSMWLDMPHSTPRIYAYVTVQTDTNGKLLNYNLDYLQKQEIHVYLVAIGAWNDKTDRKLPILRASTMNIAAQMIEKSVNTGTHLQENDWIMVIAANEIVSFPQYSAWNFTLHDSLINIGREPYRFNAVALSIFFMQDPKGSPYPNVPFKMFGMHPWNFGGNTSLQLMRAPKDTLAQRVRIWQQGVKSSKVSLTLSEDINKQLVVSDVHFIGRNVYPFHAQSLRFHPSTSMPYIQLRPDILKMYVLETIVGYYEANRAEAVTDRFLY